MQPNYSQERRPPYLPTGLPHGQHRGRTMSARRYLELGRQPRLSPWLARRPPYLEAVATAAVFIFLLYVILGGV